MNELLKIENLSKSFSLNSVLKDIHFDLISGEVHAILGTNGAGKSTLIKILGGIYEKDSGEIYIDNKRVEIKNVTESQNAGIYIIHQEIALVPDKTIAANIFLGREITNKLGLIDKIKMKKISQDLLDRFNLNLNSDDLVKDLSIGMQQIIEILKVISVNNPKIIVMDEPTAALSSKEIELLYKIIRELKKQKVGIIYISHKFEDIFSISDRVSVLRDGSIVGTFSTIETSEKQLVFLMVGEELEHYWPSKVYSTGEVALEVIDYSKEKLFSHINFDAKYGEILGFYGLMGAGRTELFKTIFGILNKDEGRLLIDGVEVNIDSPKSAINNNLGFVTENRRDEGLILDASVRFNMALVNYRNYIKHLSVDLDSWQKMVGEYQEKLSIKLTSDAQKAKELSGGNQQKVVLAKWLVSNPKILILDEPTRGIDVSAKAEMFEYIVDLANQNVCVIIISSDMDEIINVCNRCYIMRDGKIVKQLQKKEFSKELIMSYSATGRDVGNSGENYEPKR